MEEGLELVAPIGAHRVDPKWELGDHVVDEVDAFC
jgi:hypothetical protein